ncbi:hypothetical protein GCM10011594_05100 [Nakamurella endophytica]|uniref:Uncharacterized protein n=1 Tax=Nakamurella endophytica TaxID=1748367 RepID=A0A917SNT4_9ACTN|nr:hypothetical protein GCM10011594_05100 [Nakamurella endophytica]
MDALAAEIATVPPTATTAATPTAVKVLAVADIRRRPVAEVAGSVQPAGAPAPGHASGGTDPPAAPGAPAGGSDPGTAAPPTAGATGGRGGTPQTGPGSSGAAVDRSSGEWSDMCRTLSVGRTVGG